MEIVASEWQHFAFWNCLEFFKNIFNPWLFESVDMETVDIEGQLYLSFLNLWAACVYYKEPSI